MEVKITEQSVIDYMDKVFDRCREKIGWGDFSTVGQITQNEDNEWVYTFAILSKEESWTIQDILRGRKNKTLEKEIDKELQQ